MLVTLPTTRWATVVRSGSTAAGAATAGRGAADCAAAADGVCSAAEDSSVVRIRPVRTIPARNPIVMQSVVKLIRLAMASSHLDGARRCFGELRKGDREAAVG